MNLRKEIRETIKAGAIVSLREFAAPDKYNEDDLEEIEWNLKRTLSSTLTKEWEKFWEIFEEAGGDIDTAADLFMKTLKSIEADDLA
jgi:hypothetical protein